jgi:hypothetical protein
MNENPNSNDKTPANKQVGGPADQSNIKPGDLVTAAKKPRKKPRGTRIYADDLQIEDLKERAAVANETLGTDHGLAFYFALTYVPERIDEFVEKELSTQPWRKKAIEEKKARDKAQEKAAKAAAKAAEAEESGLQQKDKKPASSEAEVVKTDDKAAAKAAKAEAKRLAAEPKKAAPSSSEPQVEPDPNAEEI